MDMELMSERLRELRKRHNFTQSDAAEHTGLERKSIIRYEAAQNVPNGKALVKLAEVYGTTVDYILGRTEHPKYPAANESVLPSQEIELIQLIRRVVTPEEKARIVKALNELVS